MALDKWESELVEQATGITDRDIDLTEPTRCYAETNVSTDTTVETKKTTLFERTINRIRKGMGKSAISSPTPEPLSDELIERAYIENPILNIKVSRNLKRIESIEDYLKDNTVTNPHDPTYLTEGFRKELKKIISNLKDKNSLLKTGKPAPASTKQKDL